MWYAINWIWLIIHIQNFVFKIFRENSSIYKEYDPATRFYKYRAEKYNRILDDLAKFFNMNFAKGYFLIDILCDILMGNMVDKCRTAYITHHILTIYQIIPFSLDPKTPYSFSLSGVCLGHGLLVILPKYSIQMGIPYTLFAVLSIYQGQFGCYKSHHWHNKSSKGAAILVLHTLYLGYFKCFGKFFYCKKIGDKKHINYLEQF